MTALTAPLVGGTARGSWRAVARDGHRHPSPNSGHCEAAFAGALGIRLGGRNVYGSRVEHRPVLGDGTPPRREDLGRAARLSLAVGVAATVLSVLAGMAASPGRPSAQRTPSTPDPSGRTGRRR